MVYCFKFREKMDINSMQSIWMSSITKHDSHWTISNTHTHTHTEVNAMADTFKKPLAARIATYLDLPLSCNNQSSHCVLL
jgi:hypothetical protein